MAEETSVDFNCYTPNENQDEVLANPNSRTWLCNWAGKFPRTFSGTWNVYGTPVDVCPNMPRTPTPITFYRDIIYDLNGNLIQSNDCGLYGMGYGLLPDYSEGSGERIPAVSLSLFNPLVPSDAPLSLQSRAIRVSATQQMTMSYPVVTSTCGENSVYIFALWAVGDCLFRMEITGVTF